MARIGGLRIAEVASILSVVIGMDHQVVSEAIVKNVGGTFPKEEEARIEAEYGAETARGVREVFSRAMNCPVDWYAPGMDTNAALAKLADFLKAEMPDLSPEAKARLNHCYIICWK